jgi:hypothetical protein
LLSEKNPSMRSSSGNAFHATAGGHPAKKGEKAQSFFCGRRMRYHPLIPFINCSRHEDEPQTAL